MEVVEWVLGGRHPVGSFSRQWDWRLVKIITFNVFSQFWLSVFGCTNQKWWHALKTTFYNEAAVERDVDQRNPAGDFEEKWIWISWKNTYAFCFVLLLAIQCKENNLWCFFSNLSPYRKKTIATLMGYVSNGFREINF